jgi:hypothetical protein
MNPNLFRDDLWELNGGAPQIVFDPTDVVASHDSPIEFVIVTANAEAGAVPVASRWPAARGRRTHHGKCDPATYDFARARRR